MIIFSSYVEKQADAIPIILFLHIHIPSKLEDSGWLSSGVAALHVLTILATLRMLSMMKLWAPNPP